MRVLMLGWEFPPHISGGLGTACQGLTRGLAHHGVDVLFVVPRAHGDEDAAHLELVGADRIAAPASGTGELELLALPAALRPYQTRAGAAALQGGYGPDLLAEVGRYARAVRELAARRDFDLVHAHDWMAVPAALAACQASRRPLVFHVHACEQDRCGAGADPAVEELEQLGLERADRVVSVSHYSAGVLRERYRFEPAKLRVVHNALEPRRRPRRESRRFPEPIVLFLGRVTFQKGPEYFLEAAARVVREEPRVKFVVAGAGDLLPAAIENCARLGLARHVHFTGFLSGRELERMYSMADLYVMPSVSEPFGIAPLEALALDTPVIVSRQSGVAEVLKSALTVDHWDVQGMAARIVELLRDPARRRSLAARGRREVARLCWEDAGRKLKGIYAELCA